jgi:hypothetical protein
MRSVLLLALLFACERPPTIEGSADELSFRSRGAVSSVQAERMIHEALARNESWAGRLYLVAPKAFLGRHLIGHHCVHLSEYETKRGEFRAVRPADDRAMACLEVRRDIELLSDWSRRFPVRWDVRLGKRQTRVPDGPDLVRLISSVCDPVAVDRAAEVESQYGDRPR